MTLPLPIPKLFDSDEKWDVYAQKLTPDELDELEAYLDAIKDEDTIQDLEEDYENYKRKKIQIDRWKRRSTK